ncbi:hypothetical protein [Aquimarina sp. RZ0]|uniref:hypothetical protein n=1 Tax=Aquimarina sp. RZ0 TaxID=2607730 RepID=UPI0011F0A294|nr:hypothetical protein [Aquimarina sp. RZ0]KAA1247586.1 hypothetical protein F0000_01915 [Aquimarina sp. RZ0]
MKFKLVLMLLVGFVVSTSCEKEQVNSEFNTAEKETSVTTEKLAPRPFFNKSKDILIAQFDNKPDADDIHSLAAFGCMLRHSDLRGIKHFGVQGAYGTQGGKFIDATSLFKKVFGSKWVDAKKNRNRAVNRIKNVVRPILNSNGKVWVQEAGQSTITKLWIKKLIDEGVPPSKIKSNVIVVQHSKWNERHTKRADLNYVKNKATYRPIDDGNAGFGNGPDRGPNTPSYRTVNKSFLKKAKNSRNRFAREYWREADKIIKASGFNASHSSIPKGGVDFSDCVENYWIFNTKKANSIANFWKRYVTN